MFIAGVNDTGDKVVITFYPDFTLITGVNDTGHELIAGVVDTGDQLSPV